jgi:hypothetical protein
MSTNKFFNIEISFGHSNKPSESTKGGVTICFSGTVLLDGVNFVYSSRWQHFRIQVFK